MPPLSVRRAALRATATHDADGLDGPGLEKVPRACGRAPLTAKPQAVTASALIDSPQPRRFICVPDPRAQKKRVRFALSSKADASAIFSQLAPYLEPAEEIP